MDYYGVVDYYGLLLSIVLLGIWVGFRVGYMLVVVVTRWVLLLTLRFSVNI